LAIDSQIPTLTEKVKARAFSSGADLVGIVSTERVDAVPRYWIGWQIQDYTKEPKYYMRDSKSIIVLGYQAWDDIHEVVVVRGDRKEFPVYHRIRLLTRRISSFLESLGYKTIVYPELLPQKRMAQLAGLGNFGKNTLIINPRYGPWIRLHSILTDAEMVPDKPFEEDLCRDCSECIKACPVGALKPYVVDSEKCLLGINDSKRSNPEIKPIFEQHAPRITKNGYLMCMTCQKACPYGRDERGLL